MTHRCVECDNPEQHQPHMPITDQFAYVIFEARTYYRRGYSLIDAAGNAGVHPDVLVKHLTQEDEEVHDRVWGA